MRYENILPIYWSKGFFFGSNLYYIDKTLNDILDFMSGFGRCFLRRLVQRFELTFFIKDKSQDLVKLTDPYPRPVTVPLNIIFSQINSVNHERDELYRLNILRLYLIKSYRGRCHALGKPVRGQRTWSNAWTSFNSNRTLRSYIDVVSRQMRGNVKEAKINYKVKAKKYISKKKKRKEVVKKKIIWF